MWWLRSPAKVLDGDGKVIDNTDNDVGAARPTFNLDLNSVRFISAAEGGKVDAAVDANLAAVGTATSEWKLTLKDDSRGSFTASTSTTSIEAGQSLSVTYTGAVTGDNEYVSAMIAQDDTILYYGRIAQNEASGTASVTIPAGLAPGSYTLKVFSEQVNGDQKTDYASAFVDVDLTVTRYFSSNESSSGSSSSNIMTTTEKNPDGSTTTATTNKTNGTFGPNEPITQEQMETIMNRYY